MKSIAQEASNPRYIVKVGQAGEHRLGVLHKIFWPSTQAFLQRAGLSPGMVAVDAGCGVGYITIEMAKIVGPTGKIIAIDDSEEQLSLAKKRAEEENIQNITFVRCRIEDANKHWHTPVDFIYGRFILMHVPEPLRALEALYQILAPEGIMAFEEPDMSACFAQPPIEAFSKAICWHLACGKALGLRFDIGNALYFMMRLIGLQAPQFYITQPTATSHPQKSIFSLLTRECKDKYLSNHIATEDEIEQVAKALEEFEKSPISYYGCARQYQVFGSRGRIEPKQPDEIIEELKAAIEGTPRAGL